VIVNRPFGQGGMFRRVSAKRLPDWARRLGCENWGQVFLKWILADPAVTCVIPGTRNPGHVRDNVAAASGPLPDAATRARIAGLFGSM
jgi:aryl-alcohol dehydrogenase-like predicted oxidoreductase